MSTTDWNEIELRVAILQALNVARKNNPSLGGAPGLVVMNYLDANMVQFEETLHWLVDQHLIEVGESVFQITVKGVGYLADHLPPPDPPVSPSGPPGPAPPPWSPGDPPGHWPPKRDPDDPSRVPLRRKPFGGAGEIALPLPEIQDGAGH